MAKDKTTSPLVHLEIISWFGLSPGATHIYGRLESRVDGDMVCKEVERILTPQDVKDLNMAHGAERKFGKYRAGNKTSTFCDYDDLISETLSQWRDLFPHGKLLIVGSIAVLQPQRTIDGPTAVMKRINQLHKRIEKLSWDEDEKKCQAICDEWDAIVADLPNQVLGRRRRWRPKKA